MPRIGPAAKTMISNAIDRPNRKAAAAATGEQDGRGGDHARGYKAMRGSRQDRHHTACQSHSISFAMMSPNNSSTAAQISAEMKLAA